ncbi:unnamed protein product [Camellia sinensis]
MEAKCESNVRVLQRKMAYIIGLPLSLADEEVLLQKEYFGQNGKVSKVSLSRTVGGAIQQFVNDTCSVYITYSKEEEAIQCIQSIHGLVLEGIEFTKLWVPRIICNSDRGVYCHLLLDEPLNTSSIATDKAIVKSAQKDTAHAIGAFSSHVTCSVSSKDQNRPVKTPNKSVVDVVGWSSSGPDNGNAAEDRKIIYSCSEFSSVAIDKDHLEVDYSNAMLCRVSSSSHLPMEVPRDKDSQEYSIKLFREPSKFSALERADFRPSDSCITKGQSCLTSGSRRQVLPGSYSDAREDLLPPAAQRLKASDILSQGFLCFLLIGGYNERKFQNSTESDRSFRSSNLFSSEEIVEQLRRLADDNITNDNYSSAFDAVESSIISNVLSMDFDSSDDSLTLLHSLAELLDGTDGRHEENSVNQATFSNICQVSKKRTHLPDSMEKVEHYQCGPQHHV